MEGGGLHQSVHGGFLNIHADFTVHPLHANWRRRVNLLLYFNEDWDPEYGGQLELWSTDIKTRVQVVAPVQNRCVIFTTDPDSFHGHPSRSAVRPAGHAAPWPSTTSPLRRILSCGPPSTGHARATGPARR